MFAGHIGAALALGRIERRVNIAAFVACSLLLDVLLWSYVLLGWESVSIPENFAATHQPVFTFPYSHGLAASIGWSVLAGSFAFTGFAALGSGRVRAALLVAAAVFSHWLLDALVHVPELPLAGQESMKFGLALWQNLPAALGLESLLLVAGLWLFLRGSRLPRARRASIALVALGVLALTVFGMTLAPPPPSGAAMAASSLLGIALTCGLFGWIGAARSVRRHHP